MRARKKTPESKVRARLSLGAAACAMASVVGLAFGHVGIARAAGKHGDAGGANVRAASIRSLGRSVGSPTEGRLVGGVHLDEAPYLRIVPCYRPSGAQWGIGALVALLDHSARAVHHQFPDAVLSVGQLSRQSGGDIDRHASHESGRDADVGFFIKNDQGKAIYADHFVAFRGDGTAPSWPGAHFDDAKNWALAAALATEPDARVSYLFVAAPIRARLLAYAERVGAPASVRSRAAELMVQPRGSLPHDDHFHVRISCPAGMEGCIEMPTRKRDRIARHHAAPHATPHAVAAPVQPHAPTTRPASPSHEPTIAPENPPPPEPSAPPQNLLPRPGDPAAPPPASIDEPIDDVDGLEALPD